MTLALHPAGLPSNEASQACRLRGLIHAHIPLICYAIWRKNDSGSWDDRHILATPLDVKQELEPKVQKGAVGFAAVIDLYEPMAERWDCPHEALLPDLYATLTSLLQCFRNPTSGVTPSSMSAYTSPSSAAAAEANNKPIPLPERTTLHRVMETLFCSLGFGRRLDPQTYHFWIQKHPWFGHCVHTLMVGGFSVPHQQRQPFSPSYLIGMHFQFNDAGEQGSERMRIWLGEHSGICELAMLAYLKTGLDRYPQFWKLMRQRFYAPITFFRALDTLLQDVTSYLIEISHNQGPLLTELCQNYYICLDIDPRKEYRPKKQQEGPHHSRRQHQHPDLTYYDMLDVLIISRLEALSQFMVR